MYDEAKISELESKIRVLLDNIVQLNKTIKLKETVSEELNNKVNEIEQIKRIQTLVVAENNSLKNDIQQWQ